MAKDRPPAKSWVLPSNRIPELLGEEEESNEEGSIVLDSEPSRVIGLRIGPPSAKKTKRNPDWEEDEETMDLDIEETTMQWKGKGKGRESGA